MGKISNYARVLAAKLQDVFVCDQTDSNVTTTKSVTVEQIGDAICGEQVHSDLKTDNQTIIGGINELAKDKNVADEYDDTHTYTAGDVTIYGNTLYICTTNNTTGTWDATKWSATTVQSLIGSLSTLTTTDKSSLVGAVNEIATYTPVYGNTASGAIATFDTSLALPLQDCTIEINAVQSGSGTPSPDNVRPITGFTECNVFVSGVNLWDEDYALGFWNADGVFLPSTSGYMSSKTHIPVKPNTSICVVIPNNISFYLCRYDKNKNFIDRLTLANPSQRIVQMTSETCYITFSTFPAYGITYNNDISINYPSTDTTYHKGASTTTTISLGQTVYVGELDVTTGVLTVTWAYIDTWTNVNFSFNGSTATYTEVRCALPNAKAYGTSNMKSNKLETGPADLYKINGRANTEYIHFDVPLCANAVEAKQWIIDNGIAVIYELATPQTIQLTPTQVSAIVGTNNIFTDTNGNTSVVYACSLKDYIEGQ